MSIVNGMVREVPEIKVEKRWYPDDVRDLCIREKWYTKGNNEDYEQMLEYVDLYYDNPALEHLYRVAENICRHTDEQTISNVMFLLERYCVHTFYTIDEA